MHQDLAAYVLDALDEPGAQAVRTHLAACAICSAELPGLRDAAAALAFDGEKTAPPAKLRRRVVAAARADGGGRVTVLPRRWSLLATAGIAAAAALVAVGLGLWASSVSRTLRDERAKGRVEARALAIVAHPLAERYPLTGARGAVVVTPQRDAALVVLRLPRAPSGRTYQLWVVRGGRPLPAGIFGGGGAQTVVTLERRVPKEAQVAVSLERTGGTSKPTMLLFGTETA